MTRRIRNAGQSLLAVLEHACEKRSLSDWYAVVKKSRAGLIVSVVVVGALFVPQGQDVLRSMAQGARAWQLLLFEALLAIFAFSVWYGSRFILDQDFIAMRRHQKYSSQAMRELWGENFLPRFLGAAVIAGVGVAMIRAVKGVVMTEDMHYGLVWFTGLANLAFAFVFYQAVRFRRKVVQTLGGKSGLFQYRQRETRYAALADYPVWMRIFIWAAVGVSLLLWVVIFLNLQRVAPFFGTASILLLGFVFLTIFGTALVWLGERFHLPMIVFAVIIAGVFGIWNDNHQVRRLERTFVPDREFTAKQLYESWLAEMDARYGKDRPHPMFIVAASGGGIKAAYWTASVLGDLQDKNESFASHTIIISPVSGGALGALVFATLLRESGEPRNRYLSLSRTVLSRDFLSPALGSLLFHDLPARFFPFPGVFPDRAKALETAWERAWDPRRYEDPPEEFRAWASRNPFAEGFSELYPLEREHRIPTLLINGTSVETGQRIIISHLNLGNDFKDCRNSFDILPADIPISTAAMMSARFTYMSPAGTLTRDDHIVDGGYYENSGAYTALQFFESIEPFLDRRRVTPYFIQIDNDYTSLHEVAGKKNRMIAGMFPELRSPVRALLNTRNAHGASVGERASTKFQDPETGSRYFLYTFSTPGDVKAPLGWFLSAASQEELRRQLEGDSQNINYATLNMYNTEQISSILAPYNWYARKSGTRKR